MKEIILRFINQSMDTQHSHVVIFQKNYSNQSDVETVAWKVIDSVPRDSHILHIPRSIQVASSDSWGNFTPRLEAYEGQAFDMVHERGGDTLKLSSTPSTSPKEVEVRNNLSKGSISANIYKDGKLLAVKINMTPGQKATIHLQDRLFVGVVHGIIEGEVISSAIIDQINTEINLFGVASADLVMTGGGSGKSATKYNFTLENVQLV